MNIYIYGNNSFKKEIHETLEHANIKFKLDSNSIIEDIEELEVLKSRIQANPNDIYLIDDEKIIKKNALSQKIKFLTPKDGIEEDFLLDNGIADLSVDSLKEIPKYILRKHEEQKELEPNIQSSIIDIVDEAYEDEEVESNQEVEEDDDYELDDELSRLLSNSKSYDDESIDTKKKNINLDEIESLINDDDDSKNGLSKDELSSIINFDEDLGLNNISSDYDEELVDVKDEKEVQKVEENYSFDIKDLGGDDMPNDFTEIDSLNEEDVLKALAGMDGLVAPVNSNTNNEKIELKSSNVQDIAELISKLLNNKTLEITVKIKD